MDLFLLFMFRVCHAVLSVHCSLVVTCWERANLLALLYVMFLVFLSLSMWCPGSGVVLDLSISDVCLLPFFVLFSANLHRIIMQPFQHTCK